LLLGRTDSTYITSFDYILTIATKHIAFASLRHAGLVADKPGSMHASPHINPGMTEPNKKQLDMLEYGRFRTQSQAVVYYRLRD
jgi:hypothetical protein